MSGIRTHITAVILIILQVLHACGVLTDKGAQIGSWTLGGLGLIFLRLALSEATAVTQAKLDAISKAS